MPTSPADPQARRSSPRLTWTLTLLGVASLALGLSAPDVGPPRAAAAPQEAPPEASKDPARPIVVPAGPGPVLVLSGNEQGFIRPCGCSKPALGGVHRRATAIERLRERVPDAQLVSGGNLVVLGGFQQERKFETFLISMSIMGYAAFVPGPGELKLGVEFLVQSKELAAFPFTVFNLTRSGAPVFEPTVALEGTDIVVAGLLPAGTAVQGAQVAAPLEALPRLLARVATDRRLLLFFGGDEKDARALAAAIPVERRARVHLVIGGIADAPQLLGEAGGVRLLSLGTKGRFLGFYRPEAATGGLEAYRLAEGLPGNEDVSGVLDGYRDTIKEAGLVASAPRRKAPSAYVGAKECADCHEDCSAAVAGTPHERAFATLEASNDHFDPECAGCHVTGYEIEGGFVSPEETPQLRNVTCEACHGPGADHAENLDPTPNGKLGDKFCLRCHDADNSPHFDFEKYWPKIKHPPK